MTRKSDASKIKWRASGPKEILGYDSSDDFVSTPRGFRSRAHDLRVYRTSANGWALRYHWRVTRIQVSRSGAIGAETLAAGEVEFGPHDDARAARKLAQEQAEAAYFAARKHV